MDEPREIRPFVLLKIPALGQQNIKDLRPLPVPVEEVLPHRPPVAEEAVDPKSSSSATANASPSVSDLSATEMNGQTTSPLGNTVIPVGAEKESLSPEAASSTQPTSSSPGVAGQPVGPTGPTPTSGQLPIRTPSFPAAGSESQSH